MKVSLRKVLVSAIPNRSKEYYSRISIGGNKDLNKMIKSGGTHCLLCVDNMVGLLDDEIVAEFNEVGTFNDHAEEFVVALNQALPDNYVAKVSSIFGANSMSRGTSAFFKVTHKK